MSVERGTGSSGTNGRSARDGERASSVIRHAAKPPPWRGTVFSTGLVTLATLVGLPLRALIEPTNLVMVYLLAVIAAAIRLGRIPAILASLLSVLAFDIFFVPPYYTFVVSDAQYLITFGAFLAVGLVISTLAARARQRLQAGQRREAHTMALYELSRDLAGAADGQHVAQTVIRHVEQTLASRAAVLVGQKGHLEAIHAGAGFELDAEELRTARWTFEHSAVAGRYTETLAEAQGLYLPLKTARAVVGVLGVAPEHGAEEVGVMTAQQRRLLESFASQAALAIERATLAEEAREAQLLQETEKLQAALLNSISHDLRTPLASITGALSSLEDEANVLGEAARRELIHNAREEAERLNHLVANLLKMTQLEAGALRIATELHDVEDVIGVALAQLKNRLRDRQVAVRVAKGTPLAPMDFLLMTQVLVNLLENAHKYSLPPSALEVRAGVVQNSLQIEVMDRGRGIPEGEEERIFEKFYRTRGLDDASGTGLGLSISRGVVEAHGGRIWARKREGGGSVVTVTLPLAEASQLAEESTP